MKAGRPWNLNGVDKDTREAVIEAARLSGLTVGQWLNQVLGENFAEPELGEGSALPAPAEPDDDGDTASLAKAIERLTRRLAAMDEASRASIASLPDRLDEIEHNISRLSSLRQTGAERARSLKGVADMVRALVRDADNADERARSMVEGLKARAAGGGAAPRANVQRVSQAISELEGRIVEMRNRTAPAAPEPERPQKLDEIRQRLDELLARSAENARATEPATVIDGALRALEARIDEAKADITARLAEVEAEPPPPTVSAEDINRIEERLADIAARLADSEAAQAEQLAAIAARFDAAEAERKKPKKEAELAAAIREISAHQKQIDDRAETLAMRRDQKALAAAIGALQTDLGTLGEQVSAISRVGNEQHGAFFEVAKHVESLATEKPMDRSLLNAIRGDLETMRGMIEGGARETTLGSAQAKAEGIAAQLSDLIRITPDRGKLDALSNEIASLRASLDADDSPRAIQRLEMRVSELARSLEVALASRAPDPAVERLENQMQDIAARLEGLRDTGAHTAAIHTVEQRLDGRLTEIADRLGGLMNATPRTIETAEQRLAGRFDDLAGRLSGMFDDAARPQAEAIETAEQRIAGRIDAFAGRLGGMLDDAARPQTEALEKAQRQLENRLEDIVNRLGGMFDTAPQKAAIEHVHERLSAITDRIDRLNASQKEPSAALDAIKSEIGTLRKEMAEKEMPAPVISTDNLEQQIRELAKQLDTVTQNKSSNEGLADLEVQVARLAGDLEVAKPRVAELTSIESRLDKLQALLNDTAKESIASARTEAQKAVAELSTIARDNEIDAQLVKGLMRELEGLKNSAGDTEKQTRSKLEQVSHTVAQVVDRLSVLETETVAAAARATKAAKPMRAEFRPLPKVETDTAKAEAPVPAPTPGPLDTPSLAWTAAFRGLTAPDKARVETPVPAATVEGKRPLIATRGDGIGPMPTVASPEKRAAERRADFIAAARRAAQAVAKEAAAMDAPTPLAADPQQQAADSGERKPGAFARLSQAIRNRKRPLLLAAAAIVLAIGAMQAYGKFTLPTMGAALADITPPSAEAPVSQKADGRVRNIIAEADEAAVTGGVPDTLAALVPPPAAPSTAVAFAAPEAAGSHFGSGPSQPPVGAFAAPADAAIAASDAPPLPAADSVGPADASAKPVVLASADTSSTAQPATIAGLDAHLGSPKLLNAAASGDGAAEFEIATRYAEGSVVAKDLAEAATWYQKSAEAGIAVAQYRLGSLYERGQGVAKDLTQAVNWYQRAADQGNVNAMHNLAVLMSEGVDGPPDHDKALQWFLAAGNYGVRDSQYNLGVIYARAIGVPQDLVESYKWFAIAAAQGDTDAAARRDEVAKVLSADDLSKARAAVTGWHVKPPIADANGVATPPGGWDGPGEMLSDADRQALVSKIQTLLADAGYDVGPPDGVAGAKTAAAVKAFQQKQGVEATGAIDNSLLAMLTDGK